MDMSVNEARCCREEAVTVSFWLVVAIVVVVLFALAWWFSGRAQGKPGTDARAHEDLTMRFLAHLGADVMDVPGRS